MLEPNFERRYDALPEAWAAVQRFAPIARIRTKNRHAEMLALIEHLNEVVGQAPKHSLAGLLDIVVDLVEEYEAKRFPFRAANPRDVLRALMEEHDLKQGDLKTELGSQGVVSEILSGEREINVRQAKALAKRFGTTPMAFI
jgi:HTH-type transcriptional regulator/antitoxin HigA